MSQPSVYVAGCQLTGPIQAAKGGQDLCVKMSWCMEDDRASRGAGRRRDLGVGKISTSTDASTTMLSGSSVTVGTEVAPSSVQRSQGCFV